MNETGGKKHPFLCTGTGPGKEVHGLPVPVSQELCLLNWHIQCRD